jgi:hypothetical protein
LWKKYIQRSEAGIAVPFARTLDVRFETEQPVARLPVVAKLAAANDAVH